MTDLRNAPTRSSPGAQRDLVLRLILGDAENAGSAAATLSAGGMWEQAVALAHDWKALPPLSRQISALGVRLEGMARTRLHELGTNSFLRSARVAQRGAEAAGLLDREGIPAAAFKGLAAMVLLWSGPRDRTIQDADIMVPESHLEAAVGLLERHGYRCAIPATLSSYVRFVRNSPGFAGNEAVAMVAPDSSQVDLHWRVGRAKGAEFGVQAIVSRSRRAQFLGHCFPVVDSVDGALLAIHHVVRNNLAPDTAIRDLLDLDAWYGCLLDTKQGAHFAESASAFGLVSPALAITRVLTRYRASGPSPSLAALLAEKADERTERTARNLEDLFFRQLQAGPLNADLLYLIRPEVWRQLIGSALADWSGYRKHMEMFETSKTGAPVSLGDRLRHLGKSLRRADRAHWRQLWALKRVKD